MTRTYGTGDLRVQALADVSLQVAPGELVALMGPSGSGKSTLLALAGGLDRPTEGDVLVQGVELNDQNLRQLARLRRRQIGYVFQDYNLIPTLTAQENVALPLQLDGRRRSLALSAAAVALDRVHLQAERDRYPRQLSGGQQQRVAIARALVGERTLLLADEPTGALDQRNGEDVLALLREASAAGAACLLITHDTGVAQHAHRVLRLADGRLQDAADPAR